MELRLLRCSTFSYITYTYWSDICFFRIQEDPNMDSNLSPFSIHKTRFWKVVKRQSPLVNTCFYCTTLSIEPKCSKHLIEILHNGSTLSHIIDRNFQIYDLSRNEPKRLTWFHAWWMVGCHHWPRVHKCITWYRLKKICDPPWWKTDLSHLISSLKELNRSKVSVHQLSCIGFQTLFNISKQYSDRASSWLCCSVLSC